ncbi:TA system antitoxin ParD family protein [Chimaeribacter arupi]|uniref:TA system antitoxin ParD family protein n=1 Tax=Chimaeribacter arupi TaxID=2060066 RepID=UPI000C7CB0E8|nr:hypothetical protein [Chimaeribacter arupi]PLR33269.1 hypothetical protein CYR23_13015 [Chimaeribacter arupi]
MTMNVSLNETFVDDVKKYAAASGRSVAKQLEYWVKIGRIVEDNPDLPFSFIQEIMLARSDIRSRRMKSYTRRTSGK